MTTTIRNLGYTPHSKHDRILPRTMRILRVGTPGGTAFVDRLGKVVVTTLREMMRLFGTTDGREALTPDRDQKLIFSNDGELIEIVMVVGGTKENPAVVRMRFADLADGANKAGAKIKANGATLTVPWKGVDGGGSGRGNIDTLEFTTTDDVLTITIDVGVGARDGWTAEYCYRAAA